MGCKLKSILFTLIDLIERNSADGDFTLSAESLFRCFDFYVVKPVYVFTTRDSYVNLFG